MSEEKEILNELPEEEAALTEETVEQAEEAVETEEILEDEEAEEADETVLAEQDLLDGDPEEAEVAAPTYEELAEDNQKLRRTNKILSVTSAVAAFLALVFLGGMLGVLFAGAEAKPYAGLEAGKTYKSNLKLGDYSALTYENTYVAPTDAAVAEKAESALKGTDYEHKDDVKGALENGDVTKLTFDGYIDGKIYENACAENYELTLGSNKFIPGFEDGLIGKKVGESVTLNLVFPADYSEESLQNKDVRFEVKILSATRTTYEELTDAIVKEITKDKYTTVTAYKDSLFAELDATAKETAKSNAQNELWSALAQSSTLKKYPDNMYNYYVERLDSQFKSYYSQYGVTNLEGFMSAIGQDLKGYVESQIVYEFAIYTIAAEQGITVEEADFADMYTQYGVSTKDALAEKIGANVWELESNILYTKVTDFLYENATAK